MKAQLDENLPPSLAKALHCLAQSDEHEVLHVSDLVPRGTNDIELFKAVAVAGVQLHITQDHHHRRQIERDAIAGSGLVVFVLNKGWSEQPFYTKAARLVEWLPRIFEQAESIRPPAVFRVPWKKQGKGKFEQVRIAR